MRKLAKTLGVEAMSLYNHVEQMTDYAASLADLPHLARVVGGYVGEHGFDYEEQFSFGLDLLLHGLERLL